MAEEWTVTYAGDALTSVPAWEVHARRPDGTIHAHVFPRSIFEIRAGEYGIDPADIDTLLDVVLHEPHIPDPQSPRQHAADAAAALGHLAADGSPVHLFNASSTKAAREAHMARVQACKRDRVRIAAAPKPAGGTDPLDVIRRAHRPDPARVAAAAQQVQHVRQALTRQARLPSSRPVIGES